jgi:hypothetical protein
MEREVPWKFGWSSAMAWSLMTQKRALCSIKKSHKLSAEYVTGFRDNKELRHLVRAKLIWQVDADRGQIGMGR